MPASTMGEAAAEIRRTRAQLHEGDEPVELPDARRATSPWSRVRTSAVGHGPSRGFFPGQRLAMPHGVAVAGERVFVLEMNGQRILMFDPTTGTVSTLCGTTEKGNDPGRLNRPAAVLAQRDILWIADLGNHRIVTVPLPALTPPPPSR